MNRKEQLEQKVVDGQVLDEHWNWVALEHEIKKEQEFLEYLNNGKVLFDKAWVSFDEAKRLQKERRERKAEAALHSNDIKVSRFPGRAPEIGPDGLEIPPPPETALIINEIPINQQLISSQKNIQYHSLLDTREQEPDKNSTKAIIIITTAVIAVGGGAAAWFFLFR